jgi:hypothetical protein
MHFISNRNEYQESSCGKRRLALKSDNLTAVCERTVWKMWESHISMGLHGLLQG